MIWLIGETIAKIRLNKTNKNWVSKGIIGDKTGSSLTEQLRRKTIWHQTETEKEVASVRVHVDRHDNTLLRLVFVQSPHKFEFSHVRVHGFGQFDGIGRAARNSDRAKPFKEMFVSLF